MYVKTDVLLLADVFAIYRKYSYNSFGLDSIHCISAPGFSNRAMLKMAKAEIELTIDHNIDLIIKKGIRGGRCDLFIIMQKQILSMLIQILIKKEIMNQTLLA